MSDRNPRVRAGALAAAGLAAAWAVTAVAPVPAASAATTASFKVVHGRLTVTGDGADNEIVLSRDAAGNILLNGGPVPVKGRRPTVVNVQTIVVSGRGGNDVIAIDETNGELPPADLDGGSGSDALTGGAAVNRLTGGSGSDTLLGRGGDDRLAGGGENDVLVGGQGLDQVFGDGGDDLLRWNPGDGSDTNEGGDGNDAIEVVGGNVTETFAASLSEDGRVLLARTAPAPFTIDIGTAEQLLLRANGGEDVLTAPRTLAQVMILTMDGGAGADSATIAGTAGADTFDVSPEPGETLLTAGDTFGMFLRAETVGVDLAVAGLPDGTRDSVTVQGDDIGNSLQLTGAPGSAAVSGLGVTVAVTGTDGARDELAVNGGDGDDLVSAVGVPPTAAGLVLRGGAGIDLVQGGQGADVLSGGDGDDFVDGNQGADIAHLDGGDDVFQWDPGDASDIVDGNAGVDTQLFNGANVGEEFAVSARGERVRFTRDIAGIVMDLGSIERLSTRTRAGADRITVDGLGGTSVTDVDFVDGDPAGTPDGAGDVLVVNGTAGPDSVVVSGSAADGIIVNGLAAQVRYFGSDGILDTLRVATGAGDDSIEANFLSAGAIAFVASGGDDDDVLIGSPGADTLEGGNGDDVLHGNGGVDVLDGGPGDNIVLR